MNILYFQLSISLLVSLGASAMANPAGVGGIGGGIVGGHGGGLVGGHGGGIVGGHGGGHGGYYHEQPDPFKFEYGVHDDKYYTDFSEHRAGDEYGNIVGEYQVALPDGRIQYVKYTADGNYGGTIMEVSYKGEARHPDIVAHGHGGHAGVGIGGGSGGLGVVG